MHYTSRKKEPRRAQEQFDRFNFLLVHQRSELFKLLRRDGGQERHDVFNARFVGRENLERVTHKIQLAGLNLVCAEDHAVRIEAVGEGERGALVLYGASAVGEQRPLTVMDRARNP